MNLHFLRHRSFGLLLYLLLLILLPVAVYLLNNLQIESKAAENEEFVTQINISANQNCETFQSGDSNCDSIVSLIDFQSFRNEFLKYKTIIVETTTRSTLRADYNNDGKVDLSDFVIFRGGYFKTLNGEVLNTNKNVVAPSGCFYKLVQCVQTPCNPVLVCNTPIPTNIPTLKISPKVTQTPASQVKSCSWCGFSCVENLSREAVCPAVMPEEGKVCKLRGDSCMAVDKE